MITHEHIKATFASLVAIDSPSLSEREMADHIKALFAGIGIALLEDKSGTVTGSTAGNLYAYVEGDQTLEPVLLAAHMDTVAPACKKQAVFHDDDRVTSDGTTVLGADDLAGVTAIYGRSERSGNRAAPTVRSSCSLRPARSCTAREPTRLTFPTSVPAVPTCLT